MRLQHCEVHGNSEARMAERGWGSWGGMFPSHQLGVWGSAVNSPVGLGAKHWRPGDLERFYRLTKRVDPDFSEIFVGVRAIEAHATNFLWAPGPPRDRRPCAWWLVECCRWVAVPHRALPTYQPAVQCSRYSIWHSVYTFVSWLSCSIMSAFIIFTVQFSFVLLHILNNSWCGWKCTQMSQMCYSVCLVR